MSCPVLDCLQISPTLLVAETNLVDLSMLFAEENSAEEPDNMQQWLDLNA